MNDKKNLSEWQMSTIGKLFAFGIGAWLTGKAAHLKIRGDAEQIDALRNALTSSRRFQDELKKPGATAESVIQKLGLKNASAREFERVLGVPWPL